MRKLLLTISCAITVLSCDNPGHEPEGIPFLNVDVIEPYGYGYDKWIFATNNETGELLDVGRIEDVSELATLKEFSKYDLSILTITQNYYNIVTYKDFDHSEIVFGSEFQQVQAPGQAGFAWVSITNYTDGQQYSPDLHFSSSFYGTAYPISPTYNDNTYGMFIRLARESVKVIVAGKRSGVLVYHIFDNVTDGSVQTADFNNFLPHQDQFTIDTGGGYVISVGLADEDRTASRLVENSHWSEDNPPMLMGTVPGFDRYETTIYSNGVYYLKRGESVTSFTPLEFSASIGNPSMTNFISSIDIPCEYKSAGWYRIFENTTTSVQVYSDDGSTLSVKYEIPPEILSRYPDLSLEGFEFSGLMYFHSSGTSTYADLLAERFKNVHKSEYGIYEINVYN